MISKCHIVQAFYDATWGRFIFAGAYDWFLRRVEIAGLSELRRELVSDAQGRTIELAAGTGLNLVHYPKAVTRLVLTEPYSHMLTALHKKLGTDRRAVIVGACAEMLPFPDASFDTIVATMILCTAEKPEYVLREIARVLKPNGQYLFLEHIRNANPTIANRQDRLQPAWYLFANGCHCNRDTVQVLKQSSLVVEELRYGRMPRAWKIIEAIITGRARRPLGKSTTGQAGTDNVYQGATQ